MILPGSTTDRETSSPVLLPSPETTANFGDFLPSRRFWRTNDAHAGDPVTGVVSGLTARRDGGGGERDSHSGGPWAVVC